MLPNITFKPRQSWFEYLESNSLSQNGFKRKFMLTSSKSREKLPSDLGNPFKLQRFSVVPYENQQFFIKKATNCITIYKVKGHLTIIFQCQI